MNIIPLDLDTISVFVTTVCSLQISLSPRGVQKTNESNKPAEPDQTVAKFSVRFSFGFESLKPKIFSSVFYLGFECTEPTEPNHIIIYFIYNINFINIWASYTYLGFSFCLKTFGPFFEKIWSGLYISCFQFSFYH